jgi:REP element-mobilizing transposase RayT
VPGGLHGGFGPLRKNSLASIINHYKGGVTKLAREIDLNFAWHPRFYDHIIRNNNELNRVRQYIKNNPKKWKFDRS